ncbi:hypothetical protein QO034_15530 [Sedimentitalea sp. JM2-8]|uniref:Uncharacterized protein n=1 Tax=Sedimentitalea xiamensis TaxID=3050037 RepID=A0ABT7FHU1_9RHOB|nr:hypothetical protein [Sedimentitalea xiamensis]MDK3074508.1 hypothetical protein [Sedimentitalea xiamensis]
MDRSIPLLLIGLVFGGGLGFTIAAANGITLDGHDHEGHGRYAGHVTESAAGHAHDTPLDLEAGANAPSLEVEVSRDPASGWNLHMKTANFRFSPQNASRKHVAGEGHAHVYIDGVKLGRFYGPWVHLDGLPEGATEIEVTLNANDHRPLTVGGTPVAQTLALGE